jgi:hypothetical protein
MSGALVGCGSVAEPSLEAGPGSTEDVAQASSALTMGCRTDPKGYLTSCVYQCGWSAYSTTTNSATCSVPSGYVLTGGGAEIDGENSPPALLTGSTFSQSPNLKTWLATSSAPLGASIRHRIRAYAIGLKIKNVSESTLRNSMQLIWTIGGTSVSHPSVTIWNEGYGQTIGGGVIQYQSPGQFLTRSLTIPTLEYWWAESKDHGTSKPGDLQAYILGMPQQFPKVPYVLRVDVVDHCLTDSGAYEVTHFDTPKTDPGVLVSIGADNTYNGAGRMLADMYPTASSDGVQGALARSTDSGTSDWGDICAQGLFLRADSGTPGP